VSLADAADGRVAAHLAQRLDGLREQERARAHAGGRERRFGARVTTTNHDYVKGCLESHGICVGSMS
jgi:hypothetical protein